MGPSIDSPCHSVRFSSPAAELCYGHGTETHSHQRRFDFASASTRPSVAAGAQLLASKSFEQHGRFVIFVTFEVRLRPSGVLARATGGVLQAMFLGKQQRLRRCYAGPDQLIASGADSWLPSGDYKIRKPHQTNRLNGVCAVLLDGFFHYPAQRGLRQPSLTGNKV